MTRPTQISRRLRRTAGALAAGTATLALAGCGVLGSSGAEAYPSGDITMVIPYEAGGTIDPTGRQVAQALEKRLGSPVVVQNTPGGAGAVGMAEIASAEADGYTVGFVASTDLAYQPLARGNANYQIDDFYSYKVSELPAILVAQSDAPWDSLDDLTSDMRAGTDIKLGTAGTGTPPDLTARAWNSLNGGGATIVPFSEGGSEALRALLSDEVDVWAGYGVAVLGQVQSGDLKVLGVLDDQNYALFPDAPTPDEGTAADYVPFSMYLTVPKNVPNQVKSTLNEAMQKVVNNDITGYLKETGQLADYQGPKGSSKYLSTLVPAYQKLIDSGGVS